jgi:hypothetical protein
MRDVRRRWMHRESVVVVGVGIAVGVVAIIAAIARRRARAMLDAWRTPHAWLAIVVGTLGAYVVCERWEAGQAAHFLVFGGAMIAVHLLVGALVGATGDRGRALRAIAAVVAAGCVVASAYLALERSELRGVAVLSGLGL